MNFVSLEAFLILLSYKDHIVHRDHRIEIIRNKICKMLPQSAVQVQGTPLPHGDM